MKQSHPAVRRTGILRSALLLSATILSLTGCFGPKTVRANADSRKLNFGVALQAGDVIDPKAIALIKENFNEFVPENTMKWKLIRPNKTFWNWSDMDTMVAFAEKNHIKMKGHTFVWHQQNPPYVENLKNREDAVALLTDQISTIMKRYRGRIYEYDVCNEVINEDGTMRDTVWSKTIGPDYIDIAFRTAREADPKARLLLNDYNNEYEGTAKGDGFYALVKGMKDRGIPIDGVGFQLHISGMYPLDEKALRANIKRFRDLGLFVSFTEVDVRITEPVTEETEKSQIAAYSKLMEIALDESNAGSVILWGYTDKRSWIPAAFPGFGSAHLFDREVKPKPAYTALKALICAQKGGI